MISENINILLADDDKDDCMFFNEALQELEQPTQLITVNGGIELMQYLRANTIQLPDVIFLDLNMPRKNGLACLEEIKQSEKFNAMQVIIFSTFFDEDTAYRLRKIGAQACICKPSDFSELKTVIQDSLAQVAEKIYAAAAQKGFLLR